MHEIYSNNIENITTTSLPTGKIYIDNIKVHSTAIEICSNPNNLSVDCIGEEQVTLDWDIQSNADYTIQYKTTSETNWTTIEDIDEPPFLLSGLSACENYEAQISTVCRDCEGNNIENTTFSNSISFQTAGSTCNISPANTTNLPTITATYLSGCSSYELDAGSGYDSYLWSNGQTTQVITVNEIGTYTVWVTNGDACRTSSEVTTEVHIPENQTPTIVSDRNDCVLGSVLLTLNNQNVLYDRWLWSTSLEYFGIGNSVSPISIAERGTYSLTVVINGGCSTIDEYKVTTANLGIQANPTPLQITGNELWDISEDDNVITVDGMVYIQSEGVLTIQSGAIVQFMGENSGIVVERGGKLIANNVEFDVSDCNGDDVWKGLEVRGNYLTGHPEDYAQNGSVNHGLILLRNGRIANAQRGISSSFLDDVVPITGLFGGGIVDVEGIVFENNLTSVYLNGTLYDNEESKIKNCYFLNSASFAEINNTQEYQQVVLRHMALPVEVRQNKFETLENSNLIGEMRGVAIRILESAYFIGDEHCLQDGNEFINTFWGIDVVSMGAEHEEAAILHNSFVGVDKGITLSGSTRDMIQRNTFDVPTPELINEDAYAILTQASKGFEISENTINTTTAGDIEAIVIIESFQEGMAGGVLLKNNINGTFEAGTQFEGNNQRIDLDCNTYGGPSYDWYIDWGSTLQPAMGACIEDFPFLAFRNNWHGTGNGGFHIFNNSLQALHLNLGAQFAPNPAANGGIFPPSWATCQFLVENCDAIVPQNCNPNSTHIGIFSDRPIDPLLLPHPISFNEITNGKSVIDPLGGQPFIGLERLQQAFWQMTDGACDRNCALQLLAAQGVDWSNRILVASYLSGKETGTANATLALLPTHNSMSIQYYSMMDLLLNYPLDANAESSLMGLIGSHNEQYIQTLAESALAIYFGHRFVRGANPIDLNGANKRSLQGSEGSTAHMYLHPNPVKNHVQIKLFGLEKNISNTLSIYDIRGNLIKRIDLNGETSVFELDITDLNSGMYFCRLHKKTTVYENQKLIVLP